jgi:Cu-processing system ATP-binding protein
VRGVSVRLGRVQALDDVALSLAAGRATMLVGPNGAGKSTLIRVILGLVRADQAVFEVDGAQAAVDRDWKGRIGYLPEAVAFSENLNGRQVLKFFAHARGVSVTRVAEVLERVGLTEAARTAIRGYSRGMRQRLGLGVSILSQPDLLILDEPTSGLDQQGLTVLWSIIREWRESGRMVLASTHDLALMERRVDEVCVLQNGRVRAHGTTEDLRRAAGLPHRIWLLVGSASDARVDLLCSALSQWGAGRVDRSEDRVLVEVPPNEIIDVMRIQGGFAGVVEGIRVEEPTLDLVYDELLGAA